MNEDNFLRMLESGEVTILETTEFEDCLEGLIRSVSAKDEDDQIMAIDRFYKVTPGRVRSDADPFLKLQHIINAIYSWRRSHFAHTIRIKELEVVNRFYRRYRSLWRQLATWILEKEDGDLLDRLSNFESFYLKSLTPEIVQKLFLETATELADRFTSTWLNDMQGTSREGNLSLLGLTSIDKLCAQLIGLQEKGCIEGLLAIEDDIEDLPPLIADFIQMVVDGNDLGLIEAGMDRYFTHLKRRVDEYQDIVTHAAVMIGQGSNPNLINEYSGNPATLCLFTDKRDSPTMNGELNALISGLLGMANLARRDGPLALQNFPQEELPPPLRNLPEIILEGGGDPELVAYLVGRIFSQLKNNLFYVEQIVSDLVRILYQGESRTTTYNILAVISGENQSNSESLPKSNLITDLVRHSKQPFQLLLHLHDYFQAATEFQGALKRLYAISDDRVLSKELASQIESNGASFLSLLGTRWSMLEDFEAAEDVSRTKIEAQISASRQQRERALAEKEPGPDTIHLIAGTEQLVEFSRVLLDIYLERQQAQERILAEVRNTSQKRIEAAAKKILGRELSSIDLTRGDIELFLAQKIFPHGRIAMAELIKGQFSNREDQQRLLSRLLVFNDILKLDDRSVQKLLREISTEELGCALQGASDAVVERFYGNMSERSQSLINEEMVNRGPASNSSVRRAQDHILEILSRLEEQGEVTIHDPEDNDNALFTG